MSRKRRQKTGRIITIVGIVAVIAIAAILIINIVRGKDGSSNRGTNALGTGILDETDEDVIPYGDNESDSYDFSGDYFDTATQNGTMTITRDGEAYSINVTYAESDDSVTIWTMTAAYDKNRKALFYRDCVRTDYITGTASDANAGGTEKYTEGTGYIYLSSGDLFWIDNKEDMGTGMLFEKTTEIGNESSAAEETEAASESEEASEEVSETEEAEAAE